MKKSKQYFYYLCSMFYVLFLISCSQVEVFEKNTIIPKQQWKSEFMAKGSVVIKDTSFFYNIYIVLRHTDAYKYNNIWLNIGLQPPGDSIHYQQTDLLLGDDANGWHGIGMNDIWEIRKLINAVPVRFKNPGTYYFAIGHVMRDDPLHHIMSVGLRIEKKTR